MTARTSSPRCVASLSSRARAHALDVIEVGDAAADVRVPAQPAAQAAAFEGAQFHEHASVDSWDQRHTPGHAGLLLGTGAHQGLCRRPRRPAVREWSETVNAASCVTRNLPVRSNARGAPGTSGRRPDHCDGVRSNDLGPRQLTMLVAAGRKRELGPTSLSARASIARHPPTQ